MISIDLLEFSTMIFKKRPIPISAEYRPTLKLVLLSIVLRNASRSKKASLLKLHLFSWALSSKENMLIVLNLLKPDPITNRNQLWSIEPSLNRILRLGVYEKVFEFSNGSYQLTDKGDLLAKKALNDPEILDVEKDFLEKVGKKINEKMVLNLSKNWIHNA